MSSINSVNITGNLASDSTFKTIANGGTVVEFCVAVEDVHVKDGEKHKWVNFVNCELWGKGAEGLSKKLTKGRHVGVSGQWKQDRWLSKDGKNRTRDKIVCRRVAFGGGEGVPQTPVKYDSVDPYAPPF